MLKGDLGATPLPDVLTSLAAENLTGCLHIDDEAGDEALVYFKDGLVYAAYVPGRRPQLGARLISSGALAPEALAEALDAQENELQGWRLGELLVHLGYVERPVVEAFTLEQLRESCFDLSRWTSGRFRFRKNEKTRADVATHASVADLLSEVGRRASQWELMSGVVHGPTAVPVLSAGGLAAAEMTLDQDQWALLCKVDGERTIAQLARDCGFTTFEAGQIVYSLVGAGLLDVEETVDPSDDDEPAEPDLRSAVSAIASVLGGDETSSLQRITDAFAPPAVEEPVEDEEPSELARLMGMAPVAEPVAEPVVEPVVEPVPELVAEETVATDGGVAELDSLSTELASLSAALADLPSLGDLPSMAMPATFEPEYPVLPAEALAEPVDVVEAPVEAEPVEEPVAEAQAGEDPFGDSLARVSEALSALLGDSLPAVAMPEAPRAPEPSAEEIEAARLEAERVERMRAAAAAELAEAHALAEAARGQRGGLRFGRRRDRGEDAAKAEADRAAEEAERLEAERAEAARAEAERLEAERAEAERAGAARLAAEEAARLEAERVEAARVAAEEAARQEAERVEAARVAAEEAARVEAERVAAEEAARLEAERLEAEHVEAARVAAEEAARQEAERVEAARVAADEAARVEAERVAEEAARLEGERVEAERVAAEEAERLEAERQEADRVEAERVEAERAAAEEADRLAALEAEAERIAAEQAAAEAARAEFAAFADPDPVPTFEVASLLREINDVDPPEPDPEPEPEPEPAPPVPVSHGRAGLSETAALMRELTSLGLDDEEPAPAGRAPQPQKPAPKEQPKKRKGLFGRG